MKKFSSIESALFGLYNIYGSSRYKTMDFSKINEVKNTSFVTSSIPNEHIITSGIIIHEIENLCDEVELSFLRVFYGYYDKRYTSHELERLAALINYRNPEVVKLCIKAYRDPNSRRYALHKNIGIMTGLTHNAVKKKVQRINDKLKQIQLRFMNTDYQLAHGINRLLHNNELI